MLSTNALAEIPPANTAASELQAASELPVLDNSEGTDGETKARAAALFDEGTALYARAEYARAAEAFLMADTLVSTSEALQSAIAAARKAQAHLLVARASERAISREAVDPELAARARLALAEAEHNLARLEVSCSPSPCVVFLDGRALDEVRLHLVPGTYRLSAQRGVSRELSADATTEHFTALAGAEYRFALEAVTRDTKTAGAISAAPMSTQTKRNPEPQVGEARGEARRGLPSWVFYGGVGASGVLTLITAWSGFNTLDQRDKLPNREAPSYAAARSDVLDSAQRTDVLLAASVVVAAGTTALGIWWTAWGQEQPLEVGTSLLLQGAELRLRGRFN